MIDFFKFRNKLNEEHGAGDQGTPSLVAKYKKGTPGQSSPAPSRQPARKGDKLNAKMDYAKKIRQDDISIKNTMSEAIINEGIAKKGYDLIYSHSTSSGNVSNILLGTYYSKEEANKALKSRQTKGTDSAVTVDEFNLKPPKINSGLDKNSPVTAIISVGDGQKPSYDFDGKQVFKNFSEYEKWSKSSSSNGIAVLEIRQATPKDPYYHKMVSEAKKMKGEDPCWKGYEMVGMKKKNGKEVPNCVPKESVEEDYDLEEMAGANMSTREIHAYLKKLGWEHVRSSGSHDVYKHPNSPDNIAVPKHKKIKPPTILGILKMAKKVKGSMDEKLDPSQGAGEYVKDFQKSDAPQFKGKSKKERQKMAVAAYLDAKRGN